MKNKLLKLTSFSIASALVLTHLIQVLTKPNYVNEVGGIETSSMVDSVFYALIGIGLTLILILLKKEYWTYVFLGLTLISFTPLLQFYNRTFSIFIGPINVELTSLGLLISHLLANPEILSKIRLKLEPSNENLKKREELKSERIESKIKRFESKFASKSKVELERIVIEGKLIPEAIEAAKRHLNKNAQ